MNNNDDTNNNNQSPTSRRHHHRVLKLDDTNEVYTLHGYIYTHGHIHHKNIRDLRCCRLFTHWTILIDFNMIDVKFLFDLLCVMVTELKTVDTAADPMWMNLKHFTYSSISHAQLVRWYAAFAKIRAVHIISSSSPPAPSPPPTTSQSLRTQIPPSIRHF